MAIAAFGVVVVFFCVVVCATLHGVLVASGFFLVVVGDGDGDGDGDSDSDGDGDAADDDRDSDDGISVDHCLLGCQEYLQENDESGVDEKECGFSW